MKVLRELAYSFGAVASSISYQAFAVYIVFFYVDVMKLPPDLAILAMLIYGIWNALNDPIMGYLSDHTRSKWGRRIPYIAFGAIPLGITYYLLWVPPFSQISQVTALFFYFLIFICVFDGLYTLTSLNWASLYPEMFTTIAERSDVSTFRQTLGMLSMVFGIVLPPMIFGSLGWGWMGVIFGTIIVASLFIALLGSREKHVFSHEKQLPLWPSLRATFGNRSFLTYAFSNVFVQYSFILILVTVPFFAKYVLMVGPQQTTSILAAAFLCALIVLQVWRKLVVAFGTKKCLLAAIILFALSLPPFLFIQNYFAALWAAVLVGIGLGGFLLLPDIFLSDIIDEDEIRTGTRREGMYFGMNALIGRLAIVLEVLTLGMVFKSTGYNPYVFTQTGEFMAGLRILISVFPSVALIFAFVIICFYPLSGRGLEKMEEKLARVHHKKGAD